MLDHRLWAKYTSWPSISMTKCTNTVVHKCLNPELELKAGSQLLNISTWQNTAPFFFFFWSDCNMKLPADHPPLKPWLMSLGALTGEPNTQECFHALISCLPASVLPVWGIHRVFVRMRSDSAVTPPQTSRSAVGVVSGLSALWLLLSPACEICLGGETRFGPCAEFALGIYFRAQSASWFIL